MYRYPKDYLPRRPTRAHKIPIGPAIQNFIREQRPAVQPYPGPAAQKQTINEPVATVADQLDEPIQKTVEQTIEHATPTPISANNVAERPVNEDKWQVKALELQAEMDNFRKRQIQRANEAVDKEKGRLLHLVLPIADNLERALAHAEQSDEGLQKGVALTQRELMRLLEAEGLTRLDTAGQPFNPNLHEAVGTILAETEAGTIIEEIEAGYMLGDKLLRPARVVVAA